MADDGSGEAAGDASRGGDGLATGRAGRARWVGIGEGTSPVETLRVAGGITTAELSAATGVALDRLEGIEAGRSGVGSTELLALASAFGVDASHVLGIAPRPVSVLLAPHATAPSGREAATVEWYATQRVEGHLAVMEALGVRAPAWEGVRGVDDGAAVDGVAAAAATRAAWGLGAAPADLVGLLDDHGVLVVEHRSGVGTFVAAVLVEGGATMAVIGVEAGAPTDRAVSRLGMVRALGRLVMADAATRDGEADRFAAAFLAGPGTGPARGTTEDPMWRHDGRCQAAYEAGAISRSRARELLGRHPEVPTRDARH